jgi:hypothetical protein
MVFGVMPMPFVMAVRSMVAVALVLPVVLVLCLVAMMAGLFMFVRVFVAALSHEMGWQQLHAALRTSAWRVADDLWVHRTRVGGRAGSFWSAHVHFGNEGKSPVGRGIQEGSDPFP